MKNKILNELKILLILIIIAVILLLIFAGIEKVFNIKVSDYYQGLIVGSVLASFSYITKI